MSVKKLYSNFSQKRWGLVIGADAQHKPKVAENLTLGNALFQHLAKFATVQMIEPMVEVLRLKASE